MVFVDLNIFKRKKKLHLSIVWLCKWGISQNNAPLKCIILSTPTWINSLWQCMLSPPSLLFTLFRWSVQTRFVSLCLKIILQRLRRKIQVCFRWNKSMFINIVVFLKSHVLICWSAPVTREVIWFQHFRYWI